MAFYLSFTLCQDLVEVFFPGCQVNQLRHKQRAREFNLGLLHRPGVALWQYFCREQDLCRSLPLEGLCTCMKTLCRGCNWLPANGSCTSQVQGICIWVCRLVVCIVCSLFCAIWTIGPGLDYYYLLTASSLAITWLHHASVCLFVWGVFAYKLPICARYKRGAGVRWLLVPSGAYST